VAFGLTLGVTGLAGGASVFADRPQAVTKVIICHATGSETTPYEKIEVSQNAVNGTDTDGQGDHQGNHTGPVWFPGAKAAGVVWGDIIPPVPGVTLGLNWAEGESTYLNDCELPATGIMPATGSGSSEILLLGGVSVGLGTMLLGFKRKSAIR